MSKINQREVAEILGLSQATVSRALSGKQVSPETRRKVAATCSRLGYVPNRNAQNLALARSNNIGFAVETFGVLANDVIHRLLINICERAKQDDYSVSIILLNSIPRQSRTGFIDGVIAFASSKQYEMFLNYEEDLGCPIVLVDCDQEAPFPRVIFDDCEGGYMATEYLIGLGHTRICYIGTRESGPGEQRWLGYKKAMQAANLPLIGPVELAGWPNIDTELAPYEEQIFAFRPLPTAFIAASDQIAVALIKMLREHGFVVPDQVSVIGFNDSPLMGCYEPPLTTIRIPAEHLGKIVWDTLQAQFNGKRVPRCTKIRPHLIERKSCLRL
ncbi:MAG: LacI family DNA-binding transcriptional regulator [Limnochordia bacterium]|jgi:DNA-binding LacI/PurR family transcriptional regulator|nr:LacI family transcriptional regulator [Limnochordia bacterium]MDD2630267.1 LacI family DNA-binding transcriptional regulator [Limnochordia bacterium]MDD4518464.1 LacI family DNA-binding transcriptional regulator [Limnochordia bacterium]